MKSTAAQGASYERDCATSFRSAGWSVRETGKSGDFGADLICTAWKDSIAVQCKAYSKPVGPSAVQEAHGARSHYNTLRAAVMCEAGFTTAARTLAASTGVHLWSRRSIPAAARKAQEVAAQQRRHCVEPTPTRHYFRPPNPEPERSEEVAPQAPEPPFWRRLLRLSPHS